MYRGLCVFTLGCLLNLMPLALAEENIKLATFIVDVTPPLGSPLCDGLVEPASKIDDPLYARGVVIIGAGQPIVLCAVDWTGIGNDGHDAWRQALAQAAQTDIQRVCVHTLHQHDTPGCDFTAEALLTDVGLAGKCFDLPFLREAIHRTAEAVQKSMTQAQVITHVGVGTARVERIASNRRILGEDGRVKYFRASSSRITEAVAAPEGTIDPLCRCVLFFHQERPVVSLTYYATHPMSHYGKGAVSADFVGLARALRERETHGVTHIHFNGAGGNVAAGKYNDGSPERRPELTERMAAGMKAAYEQARQHPLPLSAATIRWKVIQATLPLRDLHADLDARRRVLQNPSISVRERGRAARDLSYALRVLHGHKIDFAALHLRDDIILLFFPGELFVEYQLWAQEMRPDAFVALAAYGDYGPGYIGTRIAYEQGGYETGIVSRTAPDVETVLKDVLQGLLEK